jgi:hypothetical protein
MKFIGQILLLFAVLFSSCEYKHRIYRKGFYVTGFISMHKNQPAQNRWNSTANSDEPAAVKKDTASFFPHTTIAFKAEQKKIGSPCLRPPVLFKPQQKKSGFTSKIKSGKIKQSVPAPTLFPENKSALPSEEIDFSLEKKINNFATVSFVLGILGLVLLAYGLVFAILAIVFSRMAIKRAEKLPYPVSGMRRARTGFILGVIGIGLFVLTVALVLALIAALI